MKSVRLSALALSCVLAGCGGGGSGSDSGTQTTAVTVPGVSTAAINNVLKKAYDDSAYILWGYGYIVGGVPQVVIGRNKLGTSFAVDPTVATYGATTSGNTLPILFPQIGPLDTAYQIGLGTNVNATSVQLVFGTDQNSAELSVPGYSNVVKWKATLTTTDVSGQSVAAEIKKDSGELINGSYAIPGQLFSAGAKTYKTTLEASVDMIFQYSRQVFITSESNLINNSSQCSSVTGGTTRLITEIQPNNTIKFFETAGDSCSRSGETLLASDGTWTKRVMGSDTLYDLVYPASIKTGKFSTLFSGAIGPSTKATNMYINKPTGSGNFYAAQLVKTGETFPSRQPHFNAAALNDLRALAGI